MDSLHVINAEAIFLLTSTIELKDSVITGQQVMLTNFEELEELSNTHAELAIEQVKILEKKLRKEKRKKFVVGAVGIAAIVLLIL